MSNGTENIYVVVAEHDGCEEMSDQPRHPKGPLVLEQYTEYAGLEKIIKRAAQMSVRHGTTRIARLKFTDLEFKEGKLI